MYNCLCHQPESDEYILRPEKKVADDSLWEVIRYYEGMGIFYRRAIKQIEEIKFMDTYSKIIKSHL